MSLKERTINVDIMTKEYTKLKYKQGDSNQTLKFKFYKNGSELDLTGYVVGIFYEKPNNEILEKTGTISANTITTTITSGVLNTAGVVKTEIFLTKSEEVSISFTILIEVEASINKNEAVQEKEEWDAIRDLLINGNNVSMIDDNSTATSKTWSSSKIDSQIKDKADKTTTNNIQQQVNNLVLGAVGDGNNAEVIQSRGFYDLLNTRLDIIQTGISNLINKKYNWEWVIGFVDGPTGNIVETNNRRICTKNMIYSKDDILISMNDYSLYKYGVVEYSDEENTSRKDTGWLTRDYVVKKGTYFRISIAKLSEDEEITDRFFNRLLDNINIYRLYEFKDAYSRIQALEKQYMSNNIHSLDYYPLTFGNINGYDGSIIENENRILTTAHIYLKKGCKIICNNDYLCGVASYDNNYNFIKKVEDISSYTITTDGYYLMMFYKEGYTYETTDKINEVKNNCFIIGENYAQNNMDDTYDLKYYGDKINLKPHAFKCEKLFSMSNTSSAATQSMAISNNVLFQLMGNGFVELYDFLSGEFINAYNITSEHGDCAQFGNTKYAEDDEFPLLYVTSDTTPAKIYINRVTRTSSELVKTLFFPSDKTGYYSGHAIDFEKNIVYQIGYKNNTYHINDGTNKMIVSSWDLNELTDNGNNTYTPRYIKSFELPFLITVQGQKFYDGKIYAVSSHWENTNTVIYGIDTVNERICTIIKDFPSSIKDHETEDLEFWYDTNEGDYKIILSVREKAIYKLSFK